LISEVDVIEDGLPGKAVRMELGKEGVIVSRMLHTRAEKRRWIWQTAVFEPDLDQAERLAKRYFATFRQTVQPQP
jgi:hypothetical protein